MAEIPQTSSPYGFYSYSARATPTLLEEMVLDRLRAAERANQQRHREIFAALGPLNGHTALLLVNSIGIGALIVKAFV